MSAAGEFEAAGRMFREHVNDQVEKRAHANLVARAVTHLAKVNASRKAGGRGRAAKFNERHAPILKDFRDLCEQGVAKKTPLVSWPANIR